MPFRNLFRKLGFFGLFTGIFLLVVFYVEPPKSWEQASLLQIILFFLPLLLSFTLLLDIFIKYLPHSFIISLGSLLLLAFYAVKQLNYLTGALVVLIVVFLLRIFPRMKLPRFRLTYGPKIPKLQMRKQEPPKLRGGLRRLKHV